MPRSSSATAASCSAVCRSRLPSRNGPSVGIKIASELAEWFSAQGWTAYIANSAASARSVLSAGNRIDVLITDRRMPGEGGDDLIRSIAGLPPERQPRVRALMTGEMSIRQSAELAGADVVLIKPFASEVAQLMLLDAIAKRARDIPDLADAG